MAATHTDWTVDLVHALSDDGNRYEVVDGELFVTPSPSYTHQEVAFLLAQRLHAYLKTHRVGHMFVAPVDVIFDGRTMVQPDVVVVSLKDGKRPRGPDEAGVPLLAIEIVSPTSARADRVRKRDLYLRHGIPEYWIVDPDARVIERWRPTDSRPEILTERIAWAPDAGSEPMTIDLGKFWGEVFES